MYKLWILTLISLATVNAFWLPCTDRPDAIVPNRVELHTTSRGEELITDVFAVFKDQNHVLVNEVKATIGGLEIPIESIDDDACNNLFRYGKLAGCPTIPDLEYMWETKILVSEIFVIFPNTSFRSN